MTESSNDTDLKVFDASPYLRLVIDKEGRWFQNGAEIIHPQIYAMFNSMLEKRGDGGYQVRMGREICAVEVEDAPFVVMRVIDDDPEVLRVELNDGSREEFNPDLFWIGDHHIPHMYLGAEA